MGKRPRVVVKPTPGITPEEARRLRGVAWSFVLKCWQEKQMAGAHAPDNVPNDVREANDESGSGVSGIR